MRTYCLLFLLHASSVALHPNSFVSVYSIPPFLPSFLPSFFSGIFLTTTQGVVESVQGQACHHIVQGNVLPGM